MSQPISTILCWTLAIFLALMLVVGIIRGRKDGQ